MYSTLLGLLLLAEVIIVVLAFVSKDWIETELKTRLDDMVGCDSLRRTLLGHIISRRPGFTNTYRLDASGLALLRD